MVEEMDVLETMLQELNRQLNTSPKSVLIARSSELTKMIQEVITTLDGIKICVLMVAHINSCTKNRHHNM